MTLWLIVAALGMPVEAGRAVDGVAQAVFGEEGEMAWYRARVMARRLQGRALGSLLHKGMTKDQVIGLLGKDQSPCPKDWGYCNVELWLSVQFSRDTGKMEKDGVEFGPLFEGLWQPLGN